MRRRIAVSHYMPEDHGTYLDFILPWTKAVTEAAQGTLDIEIHSGLSRFGQLEQQYEQVTTGVVDVAHSPASLPPGRFPLTSLVGLPFMAASSATGTRLLNGLLADHLGAEYEGLKVLALHADSGGVLHTRDRLVTRLEDLQGLRLRCATEPMRAALSSLGAEGVILTPPKIRAAAEQGLIDGAVMAWDVLTYTRTDEIFVHHTDTKLYVSPLYFVMNAESCADLDPKARSAIDSHSGAALAREFPGWWDRWEAPARALAHAPGHSVGYLSKAELRRWREVAGPAVESHIATLCQNGHAGARAAYVAALKLRDQISGEED